MKLAAIAAISYVLVACGNREDAGRVAAHGPLAHEADASDVAASSAAWLPPGAGAGDWAMPSRDYGGTRYSPLTEITTANVGQLQLAWSFQDGQSSYGHEMTPLVADSTM
ncbi:MAG: hypothetical protein M3Y30_14115 [Gemmatimonadota bacterium]|nr:hypothetical protein [Gemmatimonadota bacterium]